VTPEEIDLYRSVQHRRGELWAEYDKIFCEECGSYDTAISHMNNTNCKGPFIWIAPVWDEDCPERCLWAMVDWERYDLCLNTNTGLVRIWAWIDGKGGVDTIIAEGVTLPEALLRAIKEQEE